MKSKGFSLLEAIVALVLVSMVGMALFSWINTNLQNLYRIQQVQKRHEAVRNAMVFMETINPLKQPEGDTKIGFYRFKWQTQILAEPTDNTRGLKGAGIYTVGLYETDVDIYVEQELVSTVKLHQVGYKQVRDPVWKAWEE
ncbi:prepilin-type N-terminal cleavage/methylation domain-containing protein [Candidatus Albibeggiatoa sp. nov. BB20]|uniref:PulJ/GspJ family protein n=1 Tax=Candidatus Albibeggiatoa sp. nov. BB20 TaxID=3162723 RepID=UPI0033653955